MEMKKYNTPEMEVIKLSVQRAVLQPSSFTDDGTGSTPSGEISTGGSGEVPD